MLAEPTAAERAVLGAIPAAQLARLRTDDRSCTGTDEHGHRRLPGRPPIATMCFVTYELTG